MAGYVAAANLLPRAVKTEHTSIAAAALLLLGFFLMMVWVAQKPVAHGKHCVSSATADPGGEMTVPLLTDAPVNKTEEGAIPHRSSLYGSILSCTSLIGHGTSSTPSRACSIAVGSTDAITAEPQGEHGVLSTKTLSEAVLTSDYWLLFCVLLFAAGSGMTFINNLGQVGGHGSRHGHS